jgi:predicted metal-dependent hydrolase
MHQIKVNEVVIDVVRKKIKHLYLRVYPPMGRVRVAAPLKVNDEAVRLFAISKLSWIRNQKAKIEAQERQPKIEYATDETHYFEGNCYLLNVIYHNARPKVEIRDNQYIDLYVRTDSDKKQREKVLREWYRERLKEKVPFFLEKWETITNLKVNQWQVKQMKTKWGTCNIKAKRIWLNLELAKKPTICLEYIIVHELMHLLERRHNNRFKRLMSKFMPQWKIYQNELNKKLSYNKRED